jgi:predicted RNase H-like nuclease
VRFLGVDLAWGERGRTGVAALDEAGRLIASASVRTDDEICAFAAEHAPGACTAAIDAPLIVPNASGRRPCEAMTARLYGRYHAGPYPSNSSSPLFSPEPRAARLARRMGWDPDPRVPPRDDTSTCIEVYPHPAMVALFGLDRVIGYKQRGGRSLDDLRRAYGRLLPLIETACGRLGLESSPRWRAIRAAVAGASKKAELRAVEDEIDAIFCGYLAWLWAARGATACQVLGDLASGYIVIPRPLPAAAGRGPATLPGARNAAPRPRAGAGRRAGTAMR